VIIFQFVFAQFGLISPICCLSDRLVLFVGLFGLVGLVGFVWFVYWGSGEMFHDQSASSPIQPFSIRNSIVSQKDFVYFYA